MLSTAWIFPPHALKLALKSYHVNSIAYALGYLKNPLTKSKKNICCHQSSRGGHAQVKQLLFINISHGCDNVAEAGSECRMWVSLSQNRTTKKDITNQIPQLNRIRLNNSIVW